MAIELQTNKGAARAPESVMRWATRILEAQGCPGILSMEESGYHLYIPCPDCLHTHGRRELDDPKYAINLSMLAGIGEFSTVHGARSPRQMLKNLEREGKAEYGSSICMRTRSSRDPHRRAIDEIINMSTVTERFPDIHTQAALHGGAGSAEREEMWEEDPISGKKGPPPPGEVVSLADLPPEHPAVAYLVRRNYNVEQLHRQFRCSFCHKEYPYGEKGIYYRKMPGGWKDTPQHRVIFYSLVDEAPLTWQARVIEKVSEDELTRFMLHPYAGGFFPTTDTAKIRRSLEEEAEGEVDLTPGDGGYWGYVWSPTHTRANPKASWQPLSPFDEMRDGTLRFQPSKYRTAKYSSRQMMGWDAALQRAQQDPFHIKWVILCEGPLDAARVGPGGVALIGSSMSFENAAKIVSNFRVAFLAFDADRAGREATEKITKILMSPRHKARLLGNTPQLPIPRGMDLGDLTPAEYGALFKRTLKSLKRMF